MPFAKIAFRKKKQIRVCKGMKMATSARDTHNNLFSNRGAREGPNSNSSQTQVWASAPSPIIR